MLDRLSHGGGTLTEAIPAAVAASTHLSIFEDEAVLRRYRESGSGKQKRLRIGLALLVISGAHQGVETIEQVQGNQRCDHRFPCASRDDREWPASVFSLNVF